MKKIYISISIICIAVFGAIAQTSTCSPNAPCDTICPDPQVTLIAQSNQLYSEVITMNFDTSGFFKNSPLGEMIVDSVVINSVNGLPVGINWEAGCGANISCKMNLDSQLNCILLSGTSANIGFYNIVISYNIFVDSSEFAYAIFGPGGMPGERTYTLRVTATSLRFSTQTTDVSTSGNCDGAATVSVTGGKAPYTYAWNSGETTSSITGKCSDKYTFTAIDSTGIKDSTYIYISEPYYVYNTCPPHATPPPDTIITDLDTCIIDYNFPIDSVSMSSYTQTDSTNAIIDFEIYQNGQKVTFSANFKYDSTGITFIELNLHCAGSFAKALRTTTIQGGIDFQYANIGITQTTNAITATSISAIDELASLIAYPNPFGDKLTVEVARTSTVSISDANGKELSFQNVVAGSTSINTEGYNCGVYLITISDAEGVLSKKMIKK